MLKKVKFGSGGHLDRRAEPPDTFLEENNPMTISSKCCSYWVSKWFQTRRLLWEFPIGFYVQLSSVVAAILFGVLKCRTQFWKRTTQESVQQSLVEIGSVVSGKKIFLISSPFFLICIIGQNMQKFKVHKKSRNICLKANHYYYTVHIWALSGLK